MFYTPSTLTVNANDKIVGQLSCSPNARNNRDLDISIAYNIKGDATEHHVQYKMFVLSYFPLYCSFECSLFIFVQERTLISCQVLIYTNTTLVIALYLYFLPHHLQPQNCKPLPSSNLDNTYIILQVLITMFCYCGHHLSPSLVYICFTVVQLGHCEFVFAVICNQVYILVLILSVVIVTHCTSIVYIAQLRTILMAMFPGLNPAQRVHI